MAWKSTFGQNYWTILTHRVPPFAARGLSRFVDVGGHLAAEVGKSISGGGGTISSASEVYASGPDSEEEEEGTVFPGP